MKLQIRSQRQATIRYTELHPSSMDCSQSNLLAHIPTCSPPAQRDPKPHSRLIARILAILFFVGPLHDIPELQSAEPVHLGTAADTDSWQYIRRLEDEIASLNQRVGQLEAVPCGAECLSIDCHCHCQHRYSFGFEFVSVKPRLEDSLELDTDGSAIDYELRLTPRVWIAWESPSGFGLRGRYWRHDRESNPSADSTQFNENFGLAIMTFESDVVDVDVMHVFQVGHFKHALSFGIRYVEFQQRVDDATTGDYLFKEFQGSGPTTAVEGEVPFLFPGVSLYGSARASILFARSAWGDETAVVDGDDLGAVFESQIGLQWTRDVGCAMQCFIRAGFEGQLWMGIGTAFDDDSSVQEQFFDVDPVEHDVGFLGFVVAVGLTR